MKLQISCVGLSSSPALTTVERLVMSLTLFCTSSSVTSTAVQCSSSRGRWLVPFSVTQEWSCNNTYTQKYHSYRIQTPTVAVQSSFLLGHLYLRDGDSSFWVFIQHLLDQLSQFLTYRWPAKKVPQTNVVLTFFHLAIYQEGKCWVDFFFFFFKADIFTCQTQIDYIMIQQRQRNTFWSNATVNVINSSTVIN